MGENTVSWNKEAPERDIHPQRVPKRALKQRTPKNKTQVPLI
jgi:hypothetical protein